MSAPPYRVEVEAIHWPTLLPSLRLFEAFKLAIHPSKLALAYLFALLLCLLGTGMDLIWGEVVYPGDLERYTTLSAERYERWVEQMDAYAQRAADRGDDVARSGVFATAVEAEIAAFRRAVGSALSLDFGIRNFLAGQGLQSGGVIGAAGQMFVGIPRWLWDTRPVFFGLYAALAYALTALFGGAIARLAALHACCDRRPGPGVGLRFAARWYGWFLVVPLLPLVVVGAIALLLALAGLVLFNIPVLDVLGGLLYGPLLLGGFVIALVLLGLLIAVHVLYPALAVEGTDAFDAVSRAYNYVMGRPFRFLLYVAVATVYFAITFLFVSLLVYWTAWATEATVGAWTFTEAAEGVTRFEAATPDLVANGPTQPPQWDALDGPGTVAAWLVNVWLKLLLLLLPAFAVSFYFSVATWVYLLLRRAADGVEFEDLYLDEAQPQRSKDDASTESAAEASPPADSPPPPSEPADNA